MSVRGFRTLPLLFGLLCGGALNGQDVELLGEVHGTRPPAGYFRQLRTEPESFQFGREGLERLDHLRQGMSTGARLGAFRARAPTLAIGPREDPVVGTFLFPLVLGQFSDGPEIPPLGAKRFRPSSLTGRTLTTRRSPSFIPRCPGG